MGSKSRLRFSKTGKAKYISHLDLMATMRRALLRAGIRLSYSMGFNPHPYLSVALPLQVGCGSLCELMDFESEGFAEGANPIKALNAGLPDGIEASEMYAAGRKFSEIAWLDIKCEIYYDNGSPPGIVERLGGLFRSESLIIQKKTKRGVSDIDVAPFIAKAEFEPGDSGTVVMKARLSAQNPTITPSDILSVLQSAGGGIQPDLALFTRLEVFDKNMDVFK